MLQDIDRRALFVEYVAKAMVSVGTVKIVDRGQDKFRIDFYVYEGGTKLTAKDAITRYLTEAWEAYNIQFYEPRNSPSRAMYAYFCTAWF